MRRPAAEEFRGLQRADLSAQLHLHRFGLAGQVGGDPHGALRLDRSLPGGGRCVGGHPTAAPTTSSGAARPGRPVRPRWRPASRRTGSSPRSPADRGCAAPSRCTRRPDAARRRNSRASNFACGPAAAGRRPARGRPGPTAAPFTAATVGSGHSATARNPGDRPRSHLGRGAGSEARPGAEGRWLTGDHPRADLLVLDTGPPRPRQPGGEVDG